MQTRSLIHKILLYILFLFWIFILVAELLIWANLRPLFLPQVAVVDMTASVLQDTLWIPIGLALPFYLLAFLLKTSHRALHYGLLITAAAALLLWAFSDMLSYFRVLFLLLAALIFVTIRSVRRTREIRANVLAYMAVCAGMVINYGPQLLPTLPPLTGTKTGHLKILDFNISMRGQGEQRSAIIDLIKRENPDLVFIQEINSNDRKLFLRTLGENYPHQFWADRRENYNGGAILSKLPFKNSRNIDITTPFMSGHTNINEAVIRVRGQDVHLFNCHLYPAGHAFIQLIFGKRTLESFIDHTRTAYRRRQAEAEQLHHLIAGARGAVIVAGDFNDTPNSSVYRLFSEHLQNAFATAGWGLGTTYGHYSLKSSVSRHWKFILFDFLRIDHVFASAHFRTLEARVLPLDVSDHRPQVVRLALRSID